MSLESEFEGYGKMSFTGPSGAQSSILECLDSFFGIRYKILPPPSTSLPPSKCAFSSEPGLFAPCTQQHFFFPRLRQGND